MKRLVVLLLALSAGCSLKPVYHPTIHDHRISLDAGDLEKGGIAFITPSTVTGQEQEKQTVAFTVADVLGRNRPGVKLITLPETLSAVNKAGFVDAYRQMYEDYKETALLPAGVLRRIATTTGTRYLAQLQLQGFGQSSKGRFGLLGFRIMETLIGDVRLYFQIWDSRDGSIAWEGMQELRIAVDSTSEKPVMLRTLLERSAQDLVAKLP